MNKSKGLLLVAAAILISGIGQLSFFQSNEEAEAKEELKQETESLSLYQEFSTTVNDVQKKHKQQQDSSSNGIIPVSIEIPAIQVKASVVNVGKRSNGQMDVPKNDKDIGWYEPGIMPGQTGNAVMAGHVDNKTGPAIFFNLKNVKPGNEIIVENNKKEKVIFIVEKLKSYDYEEAPLEEIFGYSNSENLNLITCTGSYNRNKKTHEERLVVYTKIKKEKINKLLPVAPEAIQISGNLLTWHAVRNPDIIGYRIYRDSHDGKGQQIGSVGSNERKSFAGVEPENFSFFLTAVNIYGEESAPSEKTPIIK
jgi:sortase A